MTESLAVLADQDRCQCRDPAVRGGVAFCCPFQVRLLGGFELTVGREPVTIGPSARRLVAMLALAGHAIDRRRAAQTLWPDTAAGRASSNLRSTLWRLQQASPQLVEASSTDLRLSQDATVDTRQLTKLARTLLDQSRHFTASELSQALTADLHDDLLPEWPDEDWLHEERERLRQLRLHCLEALCGRLAAAGWYGAAVDTGLAAVRADPYRESARMAVVSAYIAEGNVADARQHYEHYRRKLREELDIEPTMPFAQMIQLSRAKYCSPGGMRLERGADGIGGQPRGGITPNRVGSTASWRVNRVIP